MEYQSKKRNIFFVLSSICTIFVRMKDEELQDKRIAVLLSGGVDSSVVVYELASRGLHPDCFYTLPA